MRDEIRQLAWGILFCSFSLTLSLFGVLVIDFLPDIAGVCFFWSFLRRHGGGQPRWVQAARLYAMVYAVGLILPLYNQQPALAHMVQRWGGTMWVLCLGVLIGRCFALLGRLAARAGRQDYAASARRFGYILWAVYGVRAALCAAGLAQLQGAASLLWLVLNLLLAAFAANCQLLAPPQAGAQEP